MAEVTKHSNIVGGSSASRVINCPGSVAMVQKMPKQPSSKYADEGTLLHNAISEILDKNLDPSEVIGMTYNKMVLTQELLDDKILPALERLDEVDPDRTMDYMVETEVGFGDFLPGVFGSTDLLGRIGGKAIVLDWKFGSGVTVDATENFQLLFYAAAAMRTPKAAWVFDGATEVECIIIQPPEIRRWTTTVERVKLFEKELDAAVRESYKHDARIVQGKHCRWCAAKPICPEMTGAVQRATQLALKELNPVQIGKFLDQADVIEGWISDLRQLAHQMLEADVAVPGYKLVAKRATRQWVNEEEAVKKLLTEGLDSDSIHKSTVISPAQAEKLLKKVKKELPDGLVISVSSGSTLAQESDPRQPVLQIGRQLTAALSKLQ